MGVTDAADAAQDPHFEFVISEEFVAHVISRIFRWQLLRGGATYVWLGILLVVGLVILVRYGIWFVVAADVLLAAILIGASYLTIRTRTRRDVLVGSEFSTTWGATTLTWSNGVVTSTIPYSLIRRVRDDGEFAIVQMVRSPRQAVFWPAEVFPPEQIAKHRIQFGGAGR